MRIVDEQQFESGAATAFISPRSAFGALIQLWHTPNWEQAHPKPAPDGLAHKLAIDPASYRVSRREAGAFEHLGIPFVVLSGIAAESRVYEGSVAGCRMGHGPLCDAAERGCVCAPVAGEN